MEEFILFEFFAGLASQPVALVFVLICAFAIVMLAPTRTAKFVRTMIGRPTVDVKVGGNGNGSGKVISRAEYEADADRNHSDHQKFAEELGGIKKDIKEIKGNVKAIKDIIVDGGVK